MTDGDNLQFCSMYLWNGAVFYCPDVELSLLAAGISCRSQKKGGWTFMSVFEGKAITVIKPMGGLAAIEQYEADMLGAVALQTQEPFACTPSICAIYSYDEGEEKAAIFRTANDTYINYYGWMGECLSDTDAKWCSSAGPFDSFEKAEVMLLRHRQKAVKITSE